MDLGTVLTVVEGEETGEVEASIIGFPVPEEDGDPAAIGAVDTAERKKL